MQAEADCAECGVECWVPEGTSHLRCICTDCFDEAEHRRYLSERQERTRVERLKSRSEDRTILLAAGVAGLAVLLGGLGWGPAILAAIGAVFVMGLTAHWWN